MTQLHQESTDALYARLATTILKVRFLTPSPHYRWYIVALTLVNQALSVGILVYSFALFVVPWLEEFSVSRSQVMMAIFIFQVVIGILSPVFGRLMDQYAMRWLVVAGGALTGVGLCLLSFATSFWQIVVVYATFLPMGMILCGTLASQTMVSKWFVDKRGLAIGLSAMGTSLGGFVFPLITSSLIAQYEWQSAVLYLGIMVIFLMIPLNLIVLRQEPPKGDLLVGGVSALDARSWTAREILSSKKFWIPVIGLVPINAAFGGVQFNLGAYVSDLGMTQDVAAQLIAITSLSMIAGKFVFGSLGDRVDHRKLYWLMACLLAFSLQFYQGSPDKFELMVAACLQGLATGGVMPMMGIMYASRFGTFAFGRVLGLVNLVLMTGSLGSIFSGWIFDLTQSYDIAFWVFSACLPPCMLVMYFLPDAETAD